MKNLFTCLLLFLTIVLSAQDAYRMKENVNDLSRDPRADQLSFISSEGLVKDDVTAREGTIVKSTGFGEVDMFFKSNEVSLPGMLLRSEFKLSISAGSLSASLSAAEKDTLTTLTLTGTIDARDFKTIRDEMPLLEELDLSGATIVAYSGTEGTQGTDNVNYLANEIPSNAFTHPDTKKGKIILRSVILPSSLWAIGNHSFTDTGLESITIPSSVRKIGFGAFSDCGALTFISIPASVTSIGMSAFDSRCWISVDVNNPAYSSRDAVLFNRAQTTLIQYPNFKAGNFDIPSTVTTIEMGAFHRCDKLTSVTIPAAVTSIGSLAFYDCNQLTSIRVKSNTPVDLSTSTLVFEGINKSICKIYVPNETVQLYKAANQWQDFTNILETDAVDNVISESAGRLATELSAEEKNTLTALTLTGPIDARDFKTIRDEMPLLEELDLSGATIVAYSGTEGTMGTDNFDYPANEIPSNAFTHPETNKGKILLKSVIFPPSLTAIGNYSFRDTGLESITIPSTVTKIGFGAFVECASLTSVSIPASVTSIGSIAFYLSTCWISVDVNNPAYSSREGVLFNKAQTTLIQCPISKVGNFDIPSTVTTIETGAFQQCTRLTSLTISASVTSIGSLAFYNCNRLASIQVKSNTPVDLSSSTFVFGGIDKSNCKIYVPSGTVSLYKASSQWQDFTNILETGAVNNAVSVSAGRLAIELTAEEKNTLTNLTLTGPIDARDFKTIRDEMPLLEELDLSGATIVAYSGTEGTQETNTYHTYPANEIPAYAFSDYYSNVGKISLKSVVFPSSLTAIGNYSFRDTGLESITIPSTVTKIGFGAFVECYSLTSVSIPASVTSIGIIAFYHSKCWISVDVNNPAYSSIDGILYNKAQTTLIQCPISKVGSVDIPSTVTTIETGAFQQCDKLTSVTIPAAVTSIGSLAFYNCNGLTSIYAKGTTPVELDPTKMALTRINKSLCKLYVPAGTASLYASANEWKDFINIIDFEKPELLISQTSVNLTAGEGSRSTVEIQSNASWTVVCDQTWLTVSPSSGRGNATLTLTAKANSESTNRSAKLTVSSANLSAKTIMVTQQSSVLASNHFAPDWNGNGFDHMNLNIYSASLNGIEMEPGDEIGVFDGDHCVGVGILKGSLSPTSFLNITVSRNDGSGNGYTVGNPITYKLYDRSTAREMVFSSIVYNSSNPTWSTDGKFTIGATAFVELAGSTVHFIPIWKGNGVDHMNINIYSVIVNGEELESGDEIGIFDGLKCVGSGILTQTIAGLNILNIAVSRNDGSGNGYTSGNPITYKIYDQSKGLEISDVTVTYERSDPAWSADGKFSVGTTAFAALKSGTNVNQNLVFNAGWNIISANVIPENVDMKNIFQPLIDAGRLQKVMDETGKTIEDLGIFGGWKNSIGNLNKAKGYKVNVTANYTLTLTGVPVQLPLDINLVSGWNIISYPCSGLQDGKALVQALIDGGKLKKVMDETGKTIENFGAFGGWKNNIGNFIPGKGYKVNVTENCVLTIADQGIKSAVIVPQLLASDHFKPVFKGNGTDHMNIHLVSLQGSGLRAGDQVGIFDGQQCVGSVTVGAEQLQEGSISIAASANDELEAWVNGFTTGHRIGVYLYRDGQSYALNIEKVGGNELFEKNGSLMARVNVNDLSDLMTGDGDAMTFNCYPNPFTREMTIEVQNREMGEVTVEIYNLSGQRVQSLVSGSTESHLVVKWDGTNDAGQKVAPGIYLCKVNGQSKQVIFRSAGN